MNEAPQIQGLKPTLFIGYCYPEKKWLDRTQDAILAAAEAVRIIAWDDRKFRFSKNWRAELSEILEDCHLAVLFVSDRFLESDFLERAEFLDMLQKAKEMDVRWVLVSHCWHEGAGLDEANALNHLDCPLDGLGVSRRDAVIADIASKLASLLKGASLENLTTLQFDAELAGKPQVQELAHHIEERKLTLAIFRIWMEWLVRSAAMVIAFAILIALLMRNFALLPIIAGFGLFLAALALILKARIDLIGQSIVGARCVRTGLMDVTLPERQRAIFTRRAADFLN